MSTKQFSHVLPGEHVYDGVLFFEYSPPDILDRVKKFQVRDDDVFIVTYPKAGESFYVTCMNPFIYLRHYPPSYTSS